jgi:ribosomal protein L2
MAIRKRKPTSPGRRFQTTPTSPRSPRSEPEKSLLGPEAAHRRPQRLRPQDLAPPRRRPQAAVPPGRLQAEQGRRAGQGRLHRVRPEPHVPHRAAALPRRREALHPRPAGVKVGDRLQNGQGSEIRAGNAMPLRYIPVGTTVHNVELRPRRRRQDGPQRRLERAAGRQGGRLRHPAPAQHRDAPGADRLPSPPSARSATPSTSSSRSARPAATAGRASAPRPAVWP